MCHGRGEVENAQRSFEDEQGGSARLWKVDGLGNAYFNRLASSIEGFANISAAELGTHLPGGSTDRNPDLDYENDCYMEREEE